MLLKKYCHFKIEFKIIGLLQKYFSNCIYKVFLYIYNQHLIFPTSHIIISEFVWTSLALLSEASLQINLYYAGTF